MFLIKAYVHQHPVETQQFFKSSLVQFSLRFSHMLRSGTYNLTYNHRAKKCAFRNKSLLFYSLCEKKTLTIYKNGVKKIIAKEYKGRISDDYVEITYFIQA